MRRYASQGANVQEVASSKFNRLKEAQKKFQCDDGLPVHLKGGFKDKALYQFTLLLMLFGIGMSVETLWKLAVKK